MLKTDLGDEIWLVHQPDHARVSGFLAAHWGGRSGFAKPGGFAPFADPERLRQEVVHGIAEHDNGWWEWEASPPIDEADGYPLGLLEVGQRNPEDAFQRWRLGVPRLMETHPYIALLISLHAYYLYIYAFPDEQPGDDAMRHPMFGRPDKANALVRDADKTKRFLSEQANVQASLIARLRQDPAWSAAVEPAQLLPHAKLLQVLDAMSLFLSFGGRQAHEVPSVPRGSWEDRVVLRWTPAPNRRIVVDPYPFDADPLEVLLPVRVVGKGEADQAKRSPMTHLHSIPLQTVRFELASGE